MLRCGTSCPAMARMLWAWAKFAWKWRMYVERGQATRWRSFQECSTQFACAKNRPKIFRIISLCRWDSFSKFSAHFFSLLFPTSIHIILVLSLAPLHAVKRRRITKDPDDEEVHKNPVTEAYLFRPTSSFIHWVFFSPFRSACLLICLLARWFEDDGWMMELRNDACHILKYANTLWWLLWIRARSFAQAHTYTVYMQCTRIIMKICRVLEISNDDDYDKYLSTIRSNVTRDCNHWIHIIIILMIIILVTMAICYMWMPQNECDLNSCVQNGVRSTQENAQNRIVK